MLFTMFQYYLSPFYLPLKAYLYLYSGNICMLLEEKDIRQSTQIFPHISPLITCLVPKQDRFFKMHSLHIAVLNMGI